MEARTLRAVIVTAVLLVSMGAKYRSANFVVETADPRLAKQFAESAEKYRSELAKSWLGEELPNWSQPCPVKVSVGPNLGAGGATTFTFDRGEVFGWHMEIQGSAQRVLDSVLPHEITHMIYASHFRRPLPRWADEGGATSVEHYSERNKQRVMLDRFLRSGRGIAFSKMFAMTEYPADILPLYAEGYSTAEFLIQTGGRRKYIAFLDDGLKTDNWATALKGNYNIANLGELQNTWLAWVKRGSPLKSQPDAASPGGSPEMLAAVGSSPRPDKSLVLHTRDKASPATPPSPIPNALPPKLLLPVPEKSAAAAAVAANATKPSSATKDASSAGIGVANIPYTPGSTIAVSRLSVPSTGWRASYSMPSSTALAAAAAPSDADSDPYRAHVGRSQPLESPVRTTMWR